MTRPIHRPFNRPTVPVRTRPITGRESIDEFMARRVQSAIALQAPETKKEKPDAQVH